MAGSNLVPFAFGDKLLQVTDQNGAAWFVLNDACAILDIENPRNVAARLDDDEKGVCSVDTLGGPQEVTIINESGLYALVLTSRKPNAKAFRKWVTSEVIPSIRKTGSFTQRPIHYEGEALRKFSDLTLEMFGVRWEGWR